MNILIVGYPRSGNTYLGYLLSYHFNAPYYDLYDLVNSLSVVGRPRRDITLAPEAFSGNFRRLDQEKQIGAILKSHELPGLLQETHKIGLDYVAYTASDPLVLVTREPKDVAVSFFYYTFFRSTFRKRHWSRQLPYSIRHWFYLRFRFSEFVLEVADEWSQFTLEWHKMQPLVIRYEDLVRRPEDQIKRVADEFGLCFCDTYAREAIEFCRLDNLRQLEQARDPNVQESERKYRTGRSGGWRALFSEKLRLQFNAITEGVVEQV